MPQFSFPCSKIFFWAITIAFSLFFIYVNVNATTLTQTPSSDPPMDPYKQLNLILNPNGSVTRLEKHPESPPSPDPDLPNPVLSKDVIINQSKHTWVRIYVPHKALNNPHYSLAKLPVIVFYHGGGFIFYSAASTYFHDFCANMSNAIEAVVVSLDYRLAPEHRLPSAYEDAVEVLHWIKSTDDAWLTRYADYSNCYLMGESAGGNIAYIAGLRAAEIVDEMKPLKIEGLILVQPFFGGVKRTPSEIRLANSSLPLASTDAMWELSLPIGVDRDHEYCNPTVHGGSKVLDKIKFLRWRILVFGCDGDQLVDREMELVRLLKDKGLEVVGQFHAGDRHGIFVGDPSQAKKLYGIIKSLVTPLVS